REALRRAERPATEGLRDTLQRRLEVVEVALRRAFAPLELQLVAVEGHPAAGDVAPHAEQRHHVRPLLGGAERPREHPTEARVTVPAQAVAEHVRDGAAEAPQV